MKTSPIIFSDPMVRSILAGTKTQTRRKFKPTDRPENIPTRFAVDDLWVRESFAYPRWDANLPEVIYRADEDPLWSKSPVPIKWQSPIFLPRLYSRIGLKIESVRCQKLQWISESDAIAEGITIPTEGELVEPIVLYQELWDSINGFGSFQDNPWVWVITFSCRNTLI